MVHQSLGVKSERKAQAVNQRSIGLFFRRSWFLLPLYWLAARRQLPANLDACRKQTEKPLMGPRAIQKSCGF